VDGDREQLAVLGGQAQDRVDRLKRELAIAEQGQLVVQLRPRQRWMRRSINEPARD
jgi:hypothetical protein